jgi:Transposase-associated domain
MDKSWVNLDRRTNDYVKGMKDFVALAFAKVARANTIRCPCTVCKNVLFKTRAVVEFHLVKNGMDESYKIWTLHGEDPDDTNTTEDLEHEHLDDLEQENLDDSDAFEMVQTMLAGENLDNYNFGGENSGDENFSDNEDPNPEAKKFFRLLHDAKQELYPNCKKVTKLSFIIRLFQLKCLHGWSDNACEGVLELVRFLLPDGHCVPDSLYKCRKITRDLGLAYEKIDACVNDCVLFRNEYANLDKCPTYLTPRWKINI